MVSLVIASSKRSELAMDLVDSAMDISPWKHKNAKKQDKSWFQGPIPPKNRELNKGSSDFHYVDLITLS